MYILEKKKKTTKMNNNINIVNELLQHLRYFHPHNCDASARNHVLQQVQTLNATFRQMYNYSQSHNHCCYRDNCLYNGSRYGDDLRHHAGPQLRTNANDQRDLFHVSSHLLLQPQTITQIRPQTIQPQTTSTMTQQDQRLRDQQQLTTTTHANQNNSFIQRHDDDVAETIFEVELQNPSWILYVSEMEEEYESDNESDDNARISTTLQNTESNSYGKILSDSNVIEANQKKPKDNSCPICWNEFTAESIIRELKICGHIFCDNCILPWILEHNSCPKCRTRVFITHKKE